MSVDLCLNFVLHSVKSDATGSLFRRGVVGSSGLLDWDWRVQGIVMYMAGTLAEVVRVGLPFSLILHSLSSSTASLHFTASLSQGSQTFLCSLDSKEMKVEAASSCKA